MRTTANTTELDAAAPGGGDISQNILKADLCVQNISDLNSKIKNPLELRLVELHCKIIACSVDAAPHASRRLSKTVRTTTDAYVWETTVTWPGLVTFVPRYMMVTWKQI